jgi:hypothetical protein
MSLDGSTYTFIPYTLNGINNLATTNDIAGCVKYSGNTSNTDLGTYNLTTTGTITTNTINAQNHATPDSLSNSESWLTYSISTFGNPSTLGGLITTEINSGNSMYFTGGVVGSPNFQFTSLGVGAGKVLATDANKVISTTINASQLDYITALTSQAGGVGQSNTWTGSNTFNTLTNVASLRITSSVANDDYTMSVNGFGQLEITNLTTSQLIKTDGGSFWTPNGNIYCNQTVYSNDLQLAGTSYFAYGTGQQWGTTLNGSGQYEIQDDSGVMRLRLSKTTGLTVSTLNITQVPSATPTYALGVNGGGGVVSFAVPSAVNLLPLNNTWTGTNTFNSTLTAGAGYTTNLNSALATQLNSLGFNSASFTTTGITGSYSPPLGTLTNVSGSTYQIAQTANGQSVMAISSFTPIVGTTYYFSINIKCSVGTATMYVEQNNSLRSPTAYALSTSFQVVNGSFYYDGTANTIVFRIYTGTASWNAQWDSFTLSTYSVLVSAPLTLNTLATSRALITDGSKNVSTSITTSTELSYLSGLTAPLITSLSTGALTVSGLTTLGTRLSGSVNTSPSGNFSIGLKGTGTEASRTAFTITGNATSGAIDKITMNYRTDINATLNILSSNTLYKYNANPNTYASLTTGASNTQSPLLDFWVGGTRKGYVGYASASELQVYCENSASLNFYTEGTQRMVIGTNGNVAIGVSPSSYKLHVEGSGDVATLIKTTTNTSYSALQWGTDQANVGVIFKNGTGRTADGGVNTMTVRNDGGNLRLQNGGSTASITLQGSTIFLNTGVLYGAEQPYCILYGGNNNGSVYYGVGSILFSGNALTVYQSYGMTNTTGNGWDGTNGRFYAVATGRWMLNISFYINSFTAGNRVMVRRYNMFGSSIESRYCLLSGSGIGADTVVNYSGMMYLLAGDFIRVEMMSGGGGAVLFFAGIEHTHVSWTFIM